MNRVGRLLLSAAMDLLTQLVLLGAALALLAVALHLVERRLARRLAARFGWRAVLVTGWLGVPLHELAHVVACFLFRHRVVKLALLDPDPKTGTLGYVQHSYNGRSLYQQAGNFFIGIAPLVGGSLVLYLALALLLPSVRPALSLGGGAAGLEAQAAELGSLSAATFGRLWSAQHLASWRFWTFLVIALCVGAHLAPSRADLAGALPGFALLLGLLYSADVLNRTFGWWSPLGWVFMVARVLAPLVAVLAVALVLQVLLLALFEAIFHVTVPRARLEPGYEA